ncbi:uncharacterized protein [Littorina saxatilis]|uniref:uncharacterized protein n=1 Tax=Littorina saxatilis TaxID=31220 RepID=UPI0038B48523
MEEMNETASDPDALLSFEEKTFLVVYVPLKVVIVAGNLLTVLTVIVDSTRHTTPFVLTASLAVADLLIGMTVFYDLALLTMFFIYVAPYRSDSVLRPSLANNILYVSLPTGLTVFYDLALLTTPHVQPALSCPVNFIMCAALAQSTQCTTLIALDRTLTIIYPLKYPFWMTAARTAAVVTTAVFFAIVYAAAVLSFVGWSAATCDIWTAVGTHPKLFAQVAPLCVCLLVTGCLYSYILLIAYRQRSTIAKMHSAVNASGGQRRKALPHQLGSFTASRQSRASQQSKRSSQPHSEESQQQSGHGESQQYESLPQVRPRDVLQHASKQQTNNVSHFQQHRIASQQHSTSSSYYHSGKVSPQQSAPSASEQNVTMAQEGIGCRQSDCASSWQQRPHLASSEEDETTGSPSTCLKNTYVKDCASSNIAVAALNTKVQETFTENFACASSATESNSPTHESIPGNLTMNHAPSFGVSRASDNSNSTFETVSFQDQDASSSMSSQGKIASPKNTTSSRAMNSLIETTNKCSTAFTLPQRTSNSSGTRNSLMRTITASASSLSSSGLWKSFRMFFMVWGIYFLTMTPIIVSAWVFLFTHFSQDKVDFVVRVCFVFVYVNSGINVFIYAWKDRRLRKSLGLVLRCRWRDI